MRDDLMMLSTLSYYQRHNASAITINARGRAYPGDLFKPEFDCL